LADNNFPKGLIFKLPHNNAPDFVKGKLSIKRTELISYLQDFTAEWLNFDLKVSKDGKPYIVKDEWKPDGNKPEPKPDDMHYNEPLPKDSAVNEEEDNSLPF